MKNPENNQSNNETNPDYSNIGVCREQLTKAEDELDIAKKSVEQLENIVSFLRGQIASLEKE